MRLKRGDLVLTAALILAAALLWLGVSLLKSEGACALVTLDGVERGRYPLSEDGEFLIADGAHENLLVIKDGSASVTQASCPDKLCVKMGSIRYSGESIICLPNRLIVEIIGGAEGGEDVIAR